MDRAGFAFVFWLWVWLVLVVLLLVVFGRLNEVSSLIALDCLAPLFARFGLQAGEFDVLATLRRSGSPYALTPTALYEATMVTSGAMTNRLDRLEKAGLILRAPHPNDRRGIVVRLTEKGLALIDAAVAAHVANEHEILSGLTQTERETLSHLLEKLIGSVS